MIKNGTEDNNTMIYFEFSDEEPTDINQNFAHSMNPSMTSTSETQTLTEYRETLSYYYDIEKEENKKYLVMKYTGFRGEYLEVENTRFNWGVVIVVIVVCGIVLIFLIILGAFCFIRCRQKKRNKRNIDYNQNQYYNQPSGTPYGNTNTNTNTNTNNDFYEPPPPPGNPFQ